MPKLIRFIILNSIIGILIGWAFSALLLWMNVGNFGTLFVNSHAKGIILFLLAISSGVTFGFAYMATAVMLLPSDKRRFDEL